MEIKFLMGYMVVIKEGVHTEEDSDTVITDYIAITHICIWNRRPN